MSALTASRPRYSLVAFRQLTNKFICFRAKCVPENIRKKQERDQDVRNRQAKARADAKAHRADARKAAAARATKYAAEYANEDAELIKNRRAAKDSGDFFVEGEAKIAFAIRTRG